MVGRCRFDAPVSLLSFSFAYGLEEDDSISLDSYPLRRHKYIRLKNVPTLGIWHKSKLEMPIEDDCRKADAVEEVLTARL
jgi:hypothetical protein